VPKDVSALKGQTFDYVISLCDRAREQCPIFPDAERMVWSFPDPVAIADEKTRQRAFEDIFHGLTRRIQLLVLVAERG
jgi:ArsR family transcriptional regulator, arsenate/arsenite/antimonite-responsive transcriptional repressor / arsenate reductase (thioredoxin)